MKFKVCKECPFWTGGALGVETVEAESAEEAILGYAEKHKIEIGSPTMSKLVHIGHAEVAGSPYVSVSATRIRQEAGSN